MFWSHWTAILAFVIFEALTRFRISRTGWNEVVRLFVLLELAMVRLVKFVYPPRYLLTGGCQRRQHLISIALRQLCQGGVRGVAPVANAAEGLRRRHPRAVLPAQVADRHQVAPRIL